MGRQTIKRHRENPFKNSRQKESIFTYIFKSKDSFKIGKSKDPQKRYIQGLTFNPYLEIHKIYKGDYESALHLKFLNNKIKNEWFYLTKEECKIWFYVQLELKPNKEEVTLDFHEVKEKFGWANTTGIYEAIRNLISKDFIAKSWKGNTTYWINVNMFFNGDRKKIN